METRSQQIAQEALDHEYVYMKGFNELIDALNRPGNISKNELREIIKNTLGKIK